MSEFIVDGLWKGPVVDQHIHLDRTNRYFSAIEDFVRVGGTGIMLVHKPDFRNLPLDLTTYNEVYTETISMAQEVREKFSIDVGVVLGPHPVAWEHQIDSLGLEKSTELQISAVNLALEFIENGQAHCLGEVGRPHYPVSQDRWLVANQMLEEIMQSAAAAQTPIQLHVEDNGSHTYSELSAMAQKVGLPLSRTIRHYAPADVSPNFTHGLSCTVSVGSGSVAKIIETHSGSEVMWGMETDFLDDPRRPGAVLGPKTIPKRTNELCQLLLSENNESVVEELLLNIHSNWPRELYGIDF